MGNIAVDIFPPAYWQDFERLTLDIAKIKWQDCYAERHGRAGQTQGGIDILGYNLDADEQTGIQCKKRIIKTKPSHEHPSNTLTIKEINEELEKVKNSDHNLERFIIATSGPRDAELQKHVTSLNEKVSNFKVSIWFWDDYVEFLNHHPKLMYLYYENILKYRSEYDGKKHYLQLLSMAFDRPALRTKFHCENRAVDFIAAISATQEVVSTGRLVDRNNRVIDQVPLPTPKPNGLVKITNRLQKCRDIATDALSKGVIVEHDSCIEITDNIVCSQLNELRLEAITLLNEILNSNNVDLIELEGF